MRKPIQLSAIGCLSYCISLTGCCLSCSLETVHTCITKEECPLSSQLCNDGICCTQLESVETSCTNGADDDCDRLIDCADPDCDGKSCDDGNPTNDPDNCQASSCVGQWGCTLSETTEATCSDGQDNDCDAKKDCADEDCQGKSCNDGNSSNDPDLCQGNVCQGQGQALDCSSCANASACEGQACNDGNAANDPDRCLSGVCQGQGQGGSGTETQCSDGVDNDNDGKTDCASDPDCQGQNEPCGECGEGTRTCSNFAWGDCKGQGCVPGKRCSSETKTCQCGAELVCNAKCQCTKCEGGSGDCQPGETANGICGSICGPNKAKCTKDCYWLCDCEDSGAVCDQNKRYSVCNECQNLTDKSCIRSCPGTMCSRMNNGICGILASACDLSGVTYGECDFVGCCGGGSPPSGCN